MLCAYCGAPIRFSRLARGWFHDQPLGLFRVSRREAEDIHRDPPRKGEPLHRRTYIHPAGLGHRARRSLNEEHLRNV